jgi:HSP20 family protein
MVIRSNGYRLGDWFRDFDVIRREVDKVFDEAGFTRTGPASRMAFLPGIQSRAYPLVNLAEDGDHVYVEALAPGVDPQSLNVSVLRNQITISGEKEGPGGNGKEVHRNERAGGKFVRTLSLASEVDADKVKADYKNGILAVTLPKAEKAKPKQIVIGAA